MRELRAHLTQAIRRVRDRWPITLTQRGDSDARIIPISGEPLEEMYARGEIVRGTPLDQPVIPHEPRPGTRPSEEIIAEGREGS